jgi:hypothetical protein
MKTNNFQTQVCQVARVVFSSIHDYFFHACFGPWRETSPKKGESYPQKMWVSWPEKLQKP